MAVFNERITYNAQNGKFSYSSKATQGQGIEKCVNEYLGRIKSDILKNVSDCEFRLIFHGVRELKKANQEFLKASYTKTEPYPIIHLTTFDIFGHDNLDLSINRHKKIIDSSIWNYYVPLEVMAKDANGEVKKDQDGNPIWEYDDNYDLFVKVLEDISRNQNNHLYELAVTHEFADLNARLLEQSRLEGSHKNISPFLFHSEKEMRGFINSYEEKKTVPQQAQESASSDKTDVKLDTIRKFRWRFLLLDDKSIDRMTKANDKSNPVDICKLKILAHNLTHLGFNEEKIWFRVIDFKDLRSKNNHNRIIEEKTQRIIHEIAELDPQMKLLGKVANGSFDSTTNKYSDFQTPKGVEDIQIVIDCVKHVDAAQYCLQKYKYDIILLDYLLDKDKVHGEQEYGYQLLEKLNDWFKEKKKKEKDEKDPIHTLYVPGPNKRFFFMFTSAFTTAVHERLLAEGFAKSERGLWYIGDGACPTNTPYLFSYQLLLLMRHRLADLMKELEGGCKSIIDLLELIYVKIGEAGTEETRQKAHEHFNHLLFMREKYKRLEKDLSKIDEEHLKNNTDDAEYILMKMKSSLLIQSMLKVVHHFSGAFFEHLQHLVYLTAFGTIRQWQDMWEEYVFVNKELCDYDKYVEEEEKGKRRGKAISDAIREYIINLKENNY